MEACQRGRLGLTANELIAETRSEGSQMINSYGVITMDYQRHYNLLVEKAQQRTTDLYTERHHIVPRCLGGTDDRDNLVALTPEEHYVAHQLLVKMHPDNRSLVHAVIMMIPKSNNNKQRSNKMYGWLRRKYQFVCKQRVGAKNGSYGKSWFYNPKTSDCIKCLPEQVPQGYIKGRIYSKETKQRMSQSAKKRAADPTKNPQYGTRWIYSLEKKISKIINKNDPLPKGWYEGRKIKFT